MVTRSARINNITASGEVIDVSLASVAAYAALVAKRSESQKQLAVVETEIQGLQAIAAAHAEMGFPDQAAVQRAARVAAIIGEEPIAQPIDREQAVAVVQRRVELTAAVTELDKRISTERIRASAEICERIRPHYTQTVKDICRVLIDLHRASLDYDSLTRRMNEAGVAWAGHLRPLAPNCFGQPSLWNGALAMYLAEAVKYGFLDATDVPAELQRPGPTPDRPRGIIANITQRMRVAAARDE